MCAPVHTLTTSRSTSPLSNYPTKAITRPPAWAITPDHRPLPSGHYPNAVTPRSNPPPSHPWAVTTSPQCYPKPGYYPPPPQLYPPQPLLLAKVITPPPCGVTYLVTCLCWDTLQYHGGCSRRYRISSPGTNSCNGQQEFPSSPGSGSPVVDNTFCYYDTC